jgi:hypothetical protein
MDQAVEQERKRRVRRNVWLLAATAVAFYVGFIALTYLRGHP